MPTKKNPPAAGRSPLPAILSALLALALAPAAAIAADVTPGTYMLEGGSYMIEVRADGDGLLLVEPNKQSPYTRFDDDEFHFWNDNTQTNYGIRYIDERTIEAFKPDQPGNIGSRLVLVGADAVVENGDSARWEAIAQDYAARMQSDPDNVHAWSACAGVALKRSLSTVADADAYAQQMVQMLQQIMPAGSGSPCPEVMAF